MNNFFSLKSADLYVIMNVVKTPTRKFQYIKERTGQAYNTCYLNNLCSRTKNLRSKIYTCSIKYSLHPGTLQLSLLPLCSSVYLITLSWLSLPFGAFIHSHYNLTNSQKGELLAIFEMSPVQSMKRILNSACYRKMLEKKSGGHVQASQYPNNFTKIFLNGGYKI